MLLPQPPNVPIATPTGAPTQTWYSWFQNLYTRVGGTLAGLAPGNATYVVQTPNENLDSAQALSELNSGYAKVKTGSGVISTIPTIPNTDITGLGTLATQNGTFSGTSSGVNTGDQTITLTNDVTGSGTGTFAATLATVNSNVGSFGDGTHVTALTVNGKGLITAASNVAITGAAPTGSAGGDLSGSYPNPTVTGLTHVSGAIQAPTGINDSNGNSLLKFSASGSAVNQLSIFNAPTTGSPALTATGSDSAINIVIQPKTTGQIFLESTHTTTPVGFYSGTGYQHLTSFNFTNSSASRTVTFPDSSFTVCADTGSSNIVTVGTITTGTWNGTAIGNTYLANSSLTINGTSISLGSSGTVTAAAGTLTGSTLASGVTGSSLTSLGTISSGTWNGSVVTEVYGGTNQSSYTQGDLLYASATNTLSKLAKNTSSTRYLSNTGTSNNPAWAQINLANGVTGTLPSANGGYVTPVYAINSYTTTSTFTTPSSSSSATIYKYRILGAGGGGGGANGTNASAGGGGAGGYAEGTFTGVSGNTNITITVGGGGAAGASTGANGGNGGSSSIGSPVSITCTGGNGGTGSTNTIANSTAAGGTGGSVTVGSPAISVTGSTGMAGNTNALTTTYSVGGNGAGSIFGSGGIGSTSLTGTGGAGINYGSGGGGATYLTDVGGAGAGGIVIIEQMTP